MINPPRPGKKLLVSDIDYCIFDLNSSAERPEELARPYLHEFFATLYAHYDIIIWRCGGGCGGSGGSVAGAAAQKPTCAAMLLLGTTSDPQILRPLPLPLLLLFTPLALALHSPPPHSDPAVPQV